MPIMTSPHASDDGESRDRAGHLRLSDTRHDHHDRSVKDRFNGEERRSRRHRHDGGHNIESERRYRHRSRSKSQERHKDERRAHQSRQSRSGDRTAHEPRSHRRHRSRSQDRHDRRNDKDRGGDSHHHRKHSHRHRSRSRSPKHQSSTVSKSRKSRSPSPFRRSRAPLPSQADSFNQQGADPDAPSAERPNFGNTGLLAKASNRVTGTDIVLKYNEPADARQPNASTQDWRLFIFKEKDSSSGPSDDDLLDTVPLANRSCWLIGRERAVVDLYVEHPSASKQHAVIQFRYVTKTNEFGEKKGKVKPYLIDLESGNGTVLNGDKMASRRFMEIRSGDVMKIGSSRREYVFVLPPKQ